ncbi:MAG: single-stranded DNA-binding protein [Anaerolineales bacterium]
MANHITITGRLGKDPDLRHSAEGTAWAVFSVAEGRKDQDPNWFDVKCFGKLAEAVGQYAEKGRRVLVEGRMVQETYEKDGAERKSWKLIASGVEFLDFKKGKGAEAVETEGEAAG